MLPACARSSSAKRIAACGSTKAPISVTVRHYRAAVFAWLGLMFEAPPRPGGFSGSALSSAALRCILAGAKGLANKTLCLFRMRQASRSAAWAMAKSVVHLFVTRGTQGQTMTGVKVWVPSTHWRMINLVGYFESLKGTARLAIAARSREYRGPQGDPQFLRAGIFAYAIYKVHILSIPYRREAA